MCACRTGSCWSNSTARGKKKPVKKSACMAESSDEWSDSQSDSYSGCSDCGNSDSSSSCTCSDCNPDSSDDGCCGQKKKTKKNQKVLRCKDGVCEWVSKKKLQKEKEAAVKAKKTAQKKAAKPKKTNNNNNNRKCYDCCR